MWKKRGLILLVLASAGAAVAVLAQGLSKSDEQWLERNVGAIITEAERDLFRTLPSDSDRARFKDIFWARRDPDPATPANEFREELERRIAIADERFRARVGPGSRSEMGAVFLLLGFPAKVATGRGTIPIDPNREGGIQETLEGSTSELSRDPAATTDPAFASGETGRRLQTWIYPPDEGAGLPGGLEVQFRAQPGFGYRLVRTDEVEQLLESRRLALVARPEISYRRDPEGHLEPLGDDVSSSTPAGRLLDELLATGKTSDAIAFGVSPAFFRSREGTVYAPLLFELVGTHSKNWTFFGAVGRGGSLLHRFEESANFETGGASYEIPLQLEPGAHDVFVGVLDDDSGAHGSRVATVEIPRLDGFTTSSVVLHSGATQSQESGGVPGHAFQFGTMDLEPRAQRPFRRDESLGIFFYVYGAENDAATGRPNVTVRYVFYLGEVEKAQTRPHPLASGDGQAVGTDEIALGSFEPGDYRLLVLVSDEVAGTSIERRVDFRLEP